MGIAQVGDIVLAYGELAEVLEVRKSNYDYRTYRIKYLAESPKPDIEEDWFPASYIRRIYTKEQLLANLKRLTEEGTLPSDVFERMNNLSEAELQRIMRLSIVETWHNDLKSWLKGRA